VVRKFDIRDDTVERSEDLCADFLQGAVSKYGAEPNDVESIDVSNHPSRPFQMTLRGIGFAIFYVKPPLFVQWQWKTFNANTQDWNRSGLDKLSATISRNVNS
jgi:hypothetical protein